MPVKPSPRLALLLLLSHGIAAIVVYLTVMPPAARLALFLLTLWSLLYCLARDALLLSPDSWHEISLDQGGVSVATRNGSGFSGRMAGGTIVSPYFVVLRIRREGHRLPVSRTIFPDALEEGGFRGLCVHLKLTQ